jgi:[ribosomal protein S5]-alanine N-acetyltransferase
MILRTMMDKGEGVLRRFVPSDADDLARHANDREVSLNLRDRFPHPYTLANAQAFIALASHEDPVTSFAITDAGAVVGSIGVMCGTDIERHTCEIGYWLGRAAWGRGLATEAVQEMTAYAFDMLGMYRVFAVPFVRNTASFRVLEKAGYTREGLMRRSAVKDGQVLDQYLYAAYSDSWKR